MEKAYLGGILDGIEAVRDSEDLEIGQIARMQSTLIDDRVVVVVVLTWIPSPGITERNEFSHFFF